MADQLVRAFVLDVTIAGQVHRIYFATKRDAENFISAMSTLISIKGHSGWREMDLREELEPPP